MPMKGPITLRKGYFSAFKNTVNAEFSVAVTTLQAKRAYQEQYPNALF